MTTHPIDYGSTLVCALDVSDFDRSLEWYRDALGFDLEYRLDDFGWGEMKTHLPGVNLGIGQVEEPKTDGGATLTFTVKDVEAARAHLESLGTRFDGETRLVADMVYLVTFYDPDGNSFMLAQNVQRER